MKGRDNMTEEMKNAALYCAQKLIEQDKASGMDGDMTNIVSFAMIVNESNLGFKIEEYSDVDIELTNMINNIIDEYNLTKSNGKSL